MCRGKNKISNDDLFWCNMHWCYGERLARGWCFVSVNCARLVCWAQVAGFRLLVIPKPVGYHQLPLLFSCLLWCYCRCMRYARSSLSKFLEGCLGGRVSVSVHKLLPQKCCVTLVGVIPPCAHLWPEVNISSYPVSPEVGFFLVQKYWNIKY